MADWQTIRVPQEDYETAKQAKSDRETWGDYLKRCAEQPKLVMAEDELRRFIREEINDKVVENARL